MKAARCCRQKTMNEMRFAAIIPARYASTRFPAKPLAMLGGKPVIQHVYERVKRAVSDTFVAVDDERVKSCVESFGGTAVMTSASHRSGTDRVREAYETIGLPFDAVINVQGDEPFVSARQIRALMRCFDDPRTEIATVVRPYPRNGGLSGLLDPNTPKVVADKDMFALYFSRSAIPFIRGGEQDAWPEKHVFYMHVGLYAYKAQTLRRIARLPQSGLEKAESLEQLRWLENGYRIKVGVAGCVSVGIDTPEDLGKAEALLKGNPHLLSEDE